LAKAYHIIDTEATAIMQNPGIFERNGKLVLINQWDSLNDYGMMPIYAKMADLLYFFLIDKTAVPNAADMEMLAEEIELLGEFSNELFDYFGGASAYYSAYCEYLKLTYKDNASVMSALNNLSNVATAYASFRMNSTDAQTKTAFLSAMKGIIDSYSSLSGDVKTVIDGIYSFYYEAYELLNA
jgi:hypothetical protein